MVHRLLSATLVTALLCGCSWEQVSRGIYEGSKAHNESLKGTPMEKSKGELPSYDQYDRERKAPAP